MASRRAIGLGIALSLAGCYTLQPARGVKPEVGTRVAFDVNDAGRVALGGTMGPEVAQVEGHLVGQDDSEYVLAVTNIRTIRGTEQIWTGEQVRVRSEHVSSAYRRKFSTGRSIAFGAIGIGGFAAILLSRDLLGLGSRDGKEPSESGEVRIIRP
jgi:hypothetical protein